MPPEELRRRQLEAIVAWSMAGARSQAVALVFEDLQWADPTSLELLQRLAERGAQAPLLIIATARPEFRPPWSLRSHHSVISLSSLDRAQVAQMVGELASRQALSGEMVERVSERTGGVPLFVEEVTRLLLERGEGGGLQAIPPTFSSRSRRGSTGSAQRAKSRRSARCWGAISPMPCCSFARLAGSRRTDDTALYNPRSIGSPTRTSYSSRAPGVQATYRFKHALIQDAAYESLLKSRRQALHRRAGEILRGQVRKRSGRARSHRAPFHRGRPRRPRDRMVGQGGRSGPAPLGLPGGDRPSRQGDRHGGQDSGWGVPDNSNSGDLSCRRITAERSCGQKGSPPEETEAAFARAGDLSLQTQSSAERSTVYYARWIRSFVRSEMNSARMIAESFLREAEAEGRRGDAAVARRAVGSICLFQGELALARSHIERALADIVPEQEMDARRQFGTDSRIIADNLLGIGDVVYWGTLNMLRRLTEGAIRDGHVSGHVATVVHTYLVRAILEAFRNDPAATLLAAESLLEFAREHDIALYAAWGENWSIWARGRLQDPQTGAKELRHALAAYMEQGNKIFAPHYYGLIAELEVIANRVDTALASVDAGLALAEETGERWTDSPLYRLKGNIILKQDPANLASAEKAFGRAIAIAKEQGARSFGLQAAVSLAKLRRSSNRPIDARAVLMPALEAFAPTPEMPEIAEAVALMERLA